MGDDKPRATKTATEAPARPCSRKVFIRHVQYALDTIRRAGNIPLNYI